MAALTIYKIRIRAWFSTKRIIHVVINTEVNKKINAKAIFKEIVLLSILVFQNLRRESIIIQHSNKVKIKNMKTKF